jgi:hypothetical protein
MTKGVLLAASIRNYGAVVKGRKDAKSDSQPKNQ